MGQEPSWKLHRGGGGGGLVYGSLIAGKRTGEKNAAGDAFTFYCRAQLWVTIDTQKKEKARRVLAGVTFSDPLDCWNFQNPIWERRSQWQPWRAVTFTAGTASFSGLLRQPTGPWAELCEDCSSLCGARSRRLPPQRLVEFLRALTPVRLSLFFFFSFRVKNIFRNANVKEPNTGLGHRKSVRLRCATFLAERYGGRVDTQTPPPPGWQQGEIVHQAPGGAVWFF